MSWDHIVPGEHPCSLPSIGEVRETGAGEGSRWKCDECEKLWTLSHIKVKHQLNPTTGRFERIPSYVEYEPTY